MSKFQSRLLEEKDYATLCTWWKWHRFEAPLQICLPDNGKNGVMVSKDGVDICAGFIYQTNSAMVWLEYIVSSPEYKDKNDRKEALNYLIDMLCKVAKEQGFLVAFTSLKNQSLVNRYEDSGFIKGSVGTMELIKVL